jgi:uncharacterized membrane protein
VYNLAMARRLALTLTAGAVLWIAALVLAPLALLSGPGLSAAAALIYEVGSFICHQRPERSFHLAGVQLPVCARCAGLYLSAAVAASCAWFGEGHIPAPRAARVAFALAALPTAFTVGIELVGLAQPSNAVRWLSALPLGAVAGWIFVRSLRAEAGSQPRVRRSFAL